MAILTILCLSIVATKDRRKPMHSNRRKTWIPFSNYAAEYMEEVFYRKLRTTIPR